MSSPDRSRPSHSLCSPPPPASPQVPRLPPTAHSEFDKELQEPIYENPDDAYFSSLPLSPRRVSQCPDYLPPYNPPWSQSGMMRPTGRKRGFSESSSASLLACNNSQTGSLRPMVRRQRGYSDSSSFSSSSVSSAGCGIRKNIMTQHPAGPGGNPKLDNSVLQGIWDIYRKEAGDYDAAMIDSWNASIDNLILFAGLFSGIITTFLVESYKSLAGPRPYPGHPLDEDCRMFGCGPHSTRINTMWFTSLGLSLVSALIAMLAKQWIAGYKVELLFSGTGCSEWFHEACRLRQFRFDGIRKYKMAQVISATPILLHAALMCFSIGLVDFLWTLNRTVAIPVTCLCGLTLFLYIGSTVSAVVSPRSPFKTALARLICSLRGGHLEQERVQASGTKMDEDVVEWLISTSRSQEIYQEAMQALVELRRVNMNESRAA